MISNPKHGYFRWIVIAAIIVAVVVLGIRLCTKESPTSGLIKVRMGLSGTPDILDVPYFVALEKGLFKEEGLDVKFVPLHGDAIAIQALISGNIEVTASGHFAVIRAAQEGAPIKAFVSIQRSHDYVLATPEDIKHISKLKGKTIGIYAPGDITEIVVISLLQKHGVDNDDVSWVSIGGSTDRYRALIAGKVDAVPLHADLGYKIEKESGFHILSFIAEEQPLPMSVVSTSEEYMHDKPEAIKGITKALIKACRYSMANKEGFIEVALKHIEEVDRDEISYVYDFLTSQNIYGVDGGMTRESVENAISTLVRIEELEKPVSTAEVADFTFIDSALNELSKYEP